MKTDNELIADFYCKLLNLKGTGLKDNHYYFGNIPVTYAHRSQLKFDTSWDWLMPVVEKIETLEFSTQINHDNYTHAEDRYFVRIGNGDFDGDINFFGRGNSKIEQVYKAVVEFIKWYNTQKS